MHPTAKAGFHDADKYDKDRPTYSNESVDAVIEIGGLLKSKLKPTADPKPCVLELGAGTGKFTEVFLERCAKDVRFVAIDPNTVFLEQLRQKQLPIEIMPCMANNIKLANESADLVVAAGSFHWFADRANLVEIHRVMKKGGKFVVLWYMPGCTLPWLERFHSFMRTTYTRMNTPIPSSYEWKGPFKDSLDLFIPLEQPLVCISRVEFTLQECLSYFMSLSVFAGQKGSEKEASEKEFLDIVSAIPDIKDNCAIEIPLHTEIYWVSKI